MFGKLGGLADLGKWKEVLDGGGIDIEDLSADLLPQLKECKSANDVVAVLKGAEIDFDVNGLKSSIADSGILKDSKLGKLF